MNTKPLPPDPENMNDDRALWAEVAIKAFIKETNTDQEDALADLLGDFMHWCDRSCVDFEAELTRARSFYRDETFAG